MNSKRTRVNRSLRRLTLEQMEARTMLAVDVLAMQDLLSMDVDGDLNVSATDAIGIINELNDHGTRDLHNLDPHLSESRRLHRLDTDHDGFVVPNDVLRLINTLNQDGPQDLHLGRFAGDAMAGLSSTQQGHLENLYADVNQLRMECEIAPDDVVELVDDLTQLADGLTPPSPQSVQKLVDDLVAAGQDGTLSDEEVTTLTGDVRQVLQEANVPPDQIQKVVDDLRAIVAANGITVDDVRLIADDLENILGEFAANHQHNVDLDDVRGLLQNVAAIRNGEHLTQDDLNKLAQSFTNVVGDEHAPDPQLLAQFAGDFLFANLDDHLTGEEIMRLRLELYPVLNSGLITPQVWDDVLADIHEVARLSPADETLQAIAQDMLAFADFYSSGGVNH